MKQFSQELILLMQFARNERRIAELKLQGKSTQREELFAQWLASQILR